MFAPEPKGVISKDGEQEPHKKAKMSTAPILLISVACRAVAVILKGYLWQLMTATGRKQTLA